MPPVTGEAATELLFSRPALPTLLTSLPEVEQRRCIFLQLSVKERAAACCVCRAWQQSVEGDGALWEALDLGFLCYEQRSDHEAFLNGAVARAQGRLRSLTVHSKVGEFYSKGVLPVLQRNPLLRHLRLPGSAFENIYVSNVSLELLARAGTQLETLVCSVTCSGAEEVQALLTKQAPFGALQLEGLHVDHLGGQSVFEVLGANLDQQPSLLDLCLLRLPVPPLHISVSFFDALLASKVTSISLSDCGLDVNVAAGLARLLQAGRLERLNLQNFHGLFTPEATVQLSLALRHSRSLRELVISCREEANAQLYLILPALESHPTLQALTLSFFRFSSVARDAMLRVIAADSTMLQTVHIEYLKETEVRLSALAGALLQNRHLHELHLSYYDKLPYDDDVDPSAPPASAYEEHLWLSAVLACTSLRKLVLEHDDEPMADTAAVVQLVAEREAARLAAELAKEPGRSA
jgi:hypothetical protein